MREILAHFFIPRHSNNHRSKALHFSSLFVYVILVCLLHIGLGWVSNNAPGMVLGYASNMSVSDLLKYTNEKRIQNGLGEVKLNGVLSNAASLKAANMFTEQYWSHTSPSGKDPWTFFRQAGYNYLYAGENLARDFGDSKSVVDAWMNSKTHRENLLNGRYKDIGLAVVNGKYGDYETTLVVQMFGTKPSGTASVEPESPSPAVEVVPKTEFQSVAGENVTIPNMNVFDLTKMLLLGLGLFLIAVLMIDAFVVYRKQAIRISGHNMAHFLLLLATVVILILVKRGAIV